MTDMSFTTNSPPRPHLQRSVRPHDLRVAHLTHLCFRNTSTRASGGQVSSQTAIQCKQPTTHNTYMQVGERNTCFDNVFRLYDKRRQQKDDDNDERLTANGERRTTNDERRTTNDERRTTNDEKSKMLHQLSRRRRGV